MKRHRLDPVSLVAGTLFGLIGLAFLAVGSEVPALGSGFIWSLVLVPSGILTVSLGLWQVRRLGRLSGEAASGSEEVAEPD